MGESNQNNEKEKMEFFKDERLGFVDIEIYDPKPNGWAQAKYLAHSYDDVLWTNDIDKAINFIKQGAIDIGEGLSVEVKLTVVV